MARLRRITGWVIDEKIRKRRQSPANYESLKRGSARRGATQRQTPTANNYERLERRGEMGSKLPVPDTFFSGSFTAQIEIRYRTGGKRNSKIEDQTEEGRRGHPRGLEHRGERAGGKELIGKPHRMKGQNEEGEGGNRRRESRGKPQGKEGAKRKPPGTGKRLGRVKWKIHGSENIQDSSTSG